MVPSTDDGIVKFQRFHRALAAVRALLILEQNASSVKDSQAFRSDPPTDDSGGAVERQNLTRRVRKFGLSDFVVRLEDAEFGHPVASMLWMSLGWCHVRVSPERKCMPVPETRQLLSPANLATTYLLRHQQLATAFSERDPNRFDEPAVSAERNDQTCREN